MTRVTRVLAYVSAGDDAKMLCEPQRRAWVLVACGRPDRRGAGQMKQREADAAAAADARGAPNGMLAAKQSSIFARQHNAASAKHWQILQLAPTSQPGLYKVLQPQYLPLAALAQGCPPPPPLTHAPPPHPATLTSRCALAWPGLGAAWHGSVRGAAARAAPLLRQRHAGP